MSGSGTLSVSMNYEKLIIGASNKKIIYFYKDLEANAETGRLDDVFYNENKNDLINGYAISGVLRGISATNYEFIADTIFAGGIHKGGVLDYPLKDNAKIKIKVKNLGKECIPIYNTSDANNNKIWISNICTTIYGDSSSQRGFFTQDYGRLPKIYCEATSKPANWGAYWNHFYYAGTNGPATTTWGVTEEQFDAL